jgi:hypothetical protein
MQRWGVGKIQRIERRGFRKREMRRGGVGGREIKRNAELWCGENLKERKGSSRKRGMRRIGEERSLGGDIKRNEEGEERQ